MPRQGRGPYLAIEWRGETAWYTIRDSTRKVRTGCTAGGNKPDQRAAAEKCLAEYIAQKHTVCGERRAAKVGIADVLLHFLQVKSPHLARPKETASVVQRLNAFWADKSVIEINGKNCRSYTERRLGEGVQPGRARAELVILRAAVRLYHKEYPLDVLPQVTLPEAYTPREAWLTRQQVAALLWEARRRSYRHLMRYILIAVYSGTRTNVIMGLRWLPSASDGWADVDNQLLYRKGLQAKRTANKRKPPSRLHAGLAAHMRRWREKDMAEGITHVIHYNGQPVAKLRRSWPTVRAAVTDLPDDVVLYSLKHTCATWLMQRGVDKWEVAGMLGISVEILEKHYGHHHPDFQKNAARTGTRMGQLR